MDVPSCLNLNTAVLIRSGTNRVLAEIRGDFHRASDSGARPAGLSVLGLGRQHSAEAAALAAAQRGNGMGAGHGSARLAADSNNLQVCPAAQAEVFVHA